MEDEFTSSRSQGVGVTYQQKIKKLRHPCYSKRKNYHRMVENIVLVIPIKYLKRIVGTGIKIK